VRVYSVAVVYVLGLKCVERRMPLSNKDGSSDGGTCNGGQGARWLQQSRLKENSRRNIAGSFRGLL
jgi:hypothetical protein